MKILDRYLYRELLSPFLLGILLFTFLLLIDKIFDLTDLIINKGVPFPLVALLLVYILPAFLVLTIPMGLLLAILIAFGRLSGDLEIVALKASGVSPLRLFRPVLLFSGAVGLVTAFLIMEAVPWGNYAFKSLVFDILRTQASVGLKERIFNDTFGNFVIYVEELSTPQAALRGVFVADERRPEESRVITAREGRLLTDEANRRITLRLLDGTVHETNPRELQKYRQVAFRLYDLSLTLENPLVQAGEAPKGDREMTLAELRAQAETLRVGGGNPNPYLVEIHKKYAIPAACLVFAVIGLPLGIRTHRGGRWAAFVVSLPILLLYYVFLTTGESLGDAGRIPPWLAMWGPNLLVGAIGVALLWVSSREIRLPFGAVLDALAGRFWDALVRGRPRAAPAGRVVRRRVVRRRSRHIVDRYLVREFATYFAFGLALATAIIIIGDLMVTLDRYMKLKPPLSAIL
ncbi:MAG: LPS export ABC transporter permease LptF, partial [Candidatus Rokubacteria bacterium]|nr:LPS export ABC transporter permease LptF [Candidatus Rokubacteria bacterium]